MLISSRRIRMNLSCWKTFEVFFNDEGSNALLMSCWVSLSIDDLKSKDNSNSEYTKVSASGPFVIHILFPFKIHLFPSFFAVVFIETTSEPAPGSLIARAPICSPLQSFGRYFFFWTSLPFLTSWNIKWLFLWFFYLIYT